MRARARWARVALGAAIAIAAAGACAEVDTAPRAVVALGFDTSTVAVVAGDTLRDTLGRALPLQAVAYNARSDSVAGAEISYTVAPADTGAVRLAGALVLGRQARSAAARVFATASGLQSLAKNIQVVSRPTRLVVAPTPPADTVSFVGGRSSVRSKVTDPIQLRLTADSAGTVVGVPQVVVRFAIVYAATALADSVFLHDARPLAATTTGTLDRSRFSTQDTTSAAGEAGRAVALFPRAGSGAARDSVVLRAVIAYPARHPAVRDTVRVVIPVVRTP